MKVAARSLSNPVDEWIIVKCDNLYNIKKSYIWDSFNMLSKSTAVRPEKDQTFQLVALQLFIMFIIHLDFI